MGTTDQADPSSFYQNFININKATFLNFLSPRFSAGPQKPPTETASKSNYENFEPKI